MEVALRKKGYMVLGNAQDAKTAENEIVRIVPDLVLIDIQLEGSLTGIDLAVKLDSIQIPYLFITSQTDPNTISKVKQTNPLGYIVKPFTENGLQTNIELAWHAYQSKHSEILIIKSEGQTYTISQNQILYLKAFDNYCYVYTTTKLYLVPHTLKHTSANLNKEWFIKCHRSYVVNINYIDSVGTNELFINSESIPISSSHKSLVLTKLKGK